MPLGQRWARRRSTATLPQHPRRQLQLHVMRQARGLANAPFRSVDPRSEPAPPNGRECAKVVDALLGIVRVVDEHWRAPQVGARNRTVVSAIHGIVSVVAHHEERSGGHDNRSPLVEAGRWYRRAKARATDL